MSFTFDSRGILEIAVIFRRKTFRYHLFQGPFAGPPTVLAGADAYIMRDDHWLALSFGDGALTLPLSFSFQLLDALLIFTWIWLMIDIRRCAAAWINIDTYSAANMAAAFYVMGEYIGRCSMRKMTRWWGGWYCFSTLVWVWPYSNTLPRFSHRMRD